MIDVSNLSNERYLIPHHSKAKIGLVYCAGVKVESYVFEKVSDILQAQDLPKVVTCTKKHKGKTDSSSVGVNEVLIVMEVSLFDLMTLNQPMMAHHGFQVQSVVVQCFVVINKC